MRWASAPSSSSPRPRARRRRTRCGCWRRAHRGAGGALPQPQQLRALLGGWPRRWPAAEPNGAIWANQFDNVANRQAHIETTAPEIWADTDGKVDGFVCAVGSGGTLAGVSEGSEGAEPATSGSASPTCPARRSTATTRTACSRPRAPPSPRASARAAITTISRAPGSTAPTRSPTRRCRSASSCWARRGSASAARPASTSPARSASPATSGPATHRHGALRLRHALPVQALRPGVPALQGPAGAALAGRETGIEVPYEARGLTPFEFFRFSGTTPTARGTEAEAYRSP